MKKIWIFSLLVFCAFSSQAQKKKSTTKKNSNKAYAATVAKNKKVRIDTFSLNARLEDSLRLNADSIELVKFDSVRTAWKDSMLASINVSNATKINSMIAEKEMRETRERADYIHYKKADFSNSQLQQLRIVDAQYYDDVDKVNMDVNLSPEGKAAKISALTTTRNEKIKLFVGKSKYKKLEKARSNTNA